MAKAKKTTKTTQYERGATQTFVPSLSRSTNTNSEVGPSAVGTRVPENYLHKFITY